ncbi:MAG: hypothetical protein AB8B97_15865 [Granulosicoccus sp.]
MHRLHFPMLPDTRYFVVLARLSRHFRVFVVRTMLAVIVISAL